MKISDFKVGQTVYILKRRNSNEYVEEAKVVKVGRKYLTVKRDCWYYPEEYMIPTWTMNPEYLERKSEYSYDSMLFFSENMLNEYIEKMDLRSELRKAFEWNGISKLTLYQLREIKKIFYLSGWAGIRSTIYRTETFVHESTIQPAEY